MKKRNIIISVFVMLSLMSIYVPNIMAEAEDAEEAQEEDAEFMPFTVGVFDTPQNVDPANAYDFTSYETLNQVYEGLYIYNYSSPEMESIPLLAKEMGTWDSTNINLTIELREDVLFHDNSTFNATDVKWNFDRINNFAENEMSNPSTLYFNGDEWGDGTPQLIVNRTVIINEFTVKFVLNKPYSVWESMLAFTGSFIIKPDPAFTENFLTLSDPTIGTGPFKLIEIVPDTNVTFERNMEYYSGPANITTMVYKVINDGEVASTAMLNHELHYGYVLDEHLDQAEADPDISVERVKTDVVFFLQLGYHTIPYGVRKAMQFAWNYSYYLEETMQGEAYELHTPIPDGMQYHNPDIEGLPFHNKTIARQFLIDNPGDLDNPIPSGLTATSPDSEWEAVAFGDTPLFTANFTRYYSASLDYILTQLVDNYADIGVKVVDWLIGDWGEWTEWRLIPGNEALLDISLGGWGADYNDPINMIEPIYRTDATYNTPQLDDPVLDQMMSDNYALFGQDRADSFDAIVTRLIVEDAPCFYIYQRGRREVYNNKYVSNVQDMLNAFDYMYWYNVQYMSGPKPPSIISPENLIYVYGTTGNEISWIVSDSNPDSYNISRDGINIIDSEPWISGLPIVINVDDLSIGTYEFNLTVWDSYGLISTDIVMVEVIYSTPPLIISPENIIYEYEAIGNEISWDVSDSDPDSYNISRDGINIIDSEPWISGIPIEIDVDGLAIGTYEFNLTIWDTLGSISTDLVIVEVIFPIPPTLTHPEDISYTVDTIDNTITWIATDSNPNLYAITRDGIPVASGNWTSGIPIEINVDGLAIGTYEFILTIWDILGTNSTDLVVVEVISPIPPTLTHPEDISYTVDTINNTITWIATDSNPNLYSITRDGIEVASGTWTSDNPIIINIDGLSEGAYIFTIVVTDLLGSSASDSVIVNVVESPFNIPGFPIGFLTINAFVVILGIAWKLRILKSEN